MTPRASGRKGSALNQAAVHRHRRRLYRKVGEAIYLSQILEYHLGLLIEIVNQHRGADISKADVLEFRGTRVPLGPLIASLRDILPRLAQQTERTLAVALKARNEVAHHFFWRNEKALATDAGYDAVKFALAMRAAQVAIAARQISGVLEAVCKQLGFLDADLKIPQDDLELLPACRAKHAARKRKPKRPST